MDWDAVLAFAETTTHQVGQQLMKDFGQVQADEKADGSLVTRADRWADEALRGAIAQQFPDHGVLSEEVEHIFPAADWCWIIDPVDGTTNFTRGLPLWGISLGLLYQGTPVFGYVALPPLGTAFHGYWPGESGLTMPTGAFRDRTPIFSSSADPGGNQFLNLCARSLAVLQQPVPCKVRILGVATYNLLTVAQGSAIASIEATPKIWDIAAVWVIIQAAGAIWTPLEAQPLFPLEPGVNYSQRPYPTLVTSRAPLVSTFLPLASMVGSSPSR